MPSGPVSSAGAVLLHAGHFLRSRHSFEIDVRDYPKVRVLGVFPPLYHELRGVFVNVSLPGVVPVMGTSPCRWKKCATRSDPRECGKAVGGGRNERGAYSFSLNKDSRGRKGHVREIGPRIWRRIKKSATREPREPTATRSVKTTTTTRAKQSELLVGNLVSSIYHLPPL